MKVKFIIYITFFAVALFCSNIVKGQPGRAGWFKEARYGMFIHWGLYSAAEGMWKGEKHRNANNYAEWIRYRNRIGKEEYGALAKRFEWSTINPEEWVKLAKDAGMKYIIITAKHHDGVALWDTKADEYSLPRLSGMNRDVIKEMAAACRKYGVKLGFYYSHWIDWGHPYGWDHNLELRGHVTDEQYNQYWQQKVIPQVRELLTNYGDIAIMWFDMWISYEKTILKKHQLEQLAKLIRELQPACLINSRLGIPTDDTYVDFQTLSDNQFGSYFTAHPWETPATVAHSWGYNGQETNWKSTSDIFKSLIGNVSLNGGVTLNIGPRADGSVPYECTSRLLDVGAWLKKNGSSIYGATGLQLRPGQHDWGYLTTKKENGKVTVFAHVFNWPLDKVLRISGINSKLKEVKVLASNQKLGFKQMGGLIHITTPQKQPDAYVSTLALTFDDAEITIDKELVPESSFGGFSLAPKNSVTKNPDIKKGNGNNPAYALLNNDKPLTWKIYIPQAGNYSFDLSGHNPTGKAQPVYIRVAGKELTAAIPPSLKVVVEPNEKYYTEEFSENKIGLIHFAAPGYYEVTLGTTAVSPIWFNWLWVVQKQ